MEMKTVKIVYKCLYTETVGVLPRGSSSSLGQNNTGTGVAEMAGEHPEDVSASILMPD